MKNIDKLRKSHFFDSHFQNCLLFRVCIRVVWCIWKITLSGESIETKPFSTHSNLDQYSKQVSNLRTTSGKLRILDYKNWANRNSLLFRIDLNDVANLLRPEGCKQFNWSAIELSCERRIFTMNFDGRRQTEQSTRKNAHIEQRAEFQSQLSSAFAKVFTFCTKWLANQVLLAECFW